MFSYKCLLFFTLTSPRTAWALNESWSVSLCALNGRYSSQLDGRIISSGLCRFTSFYAAQLLRLQQIPWRYCGWKMKPLCVLEGSSHLTSRLKWLYQKYKGGESVHFVLYQHDMLQLLARWFYLLIGVKWSIWRYRSIRDPSWCEKMVSPVWCSWTNLEVFFFERIF